LKSLRNQKKLRIKSSPKELPNKLYNLKNWDHTTIASNIALKSSIIFPFVMMGFINFGLVILGPRIRTFRAKGSGIR